MSRFSGGRLLPLACDPMNPHASWGGRPGLDGPPQRPRPSLPAIRPKRRAAWSGGAFCRRAAPCRPGLRAARPGHEGRKAAEAASGAPACSNIAPLSNLPQEPTEQPSRDAESVSSPRRSGLHRCLRGASYFLSGRRNRRVVVVCVGGWVGGPTIKPGNRQILGGWPHARN